MYSYNFIGDVEEEISTSLNGIMAISNHIAYFGRMA
jgi:hypothetical protein